MAIFLGFQKLLERLGKLPSALPDTIQLTPDRFVSPTSLSPSLDIDPFPPRITRAILVL